MNNRPLCLAAFALAMGICASLGRIHETYFLSIGSAAGFLLAAAFIPKPRRLKQVTLLSIFLFAFFYSSYSYQNAIWYEDFFLDGSSAEITGTVSSKSYTEGHWTILLSDSSISCRGQEYLGNAIQVSLDEAQVKLGNRICVEGTISYFHEARNPGNFDAKSYYNSKGIDFSLKGKSYKVLDDRTYLLRESLYQFKEKVKEVYEKTMTEEDAGVLSTMVLGDKTLLDADLKELYQKSGISHMLAISGLHISIVGMLLYNLLRKCGLSFFFSGLFAGLSLTVYGLMSGLSLSTFRAVTMCWLLLIGNTLGRAYDSYTALAFSAICLLLQNPLCMSQASFQLSFAAVLGVVALNPCLVQLFNPKRRKCLDTPLVSLSIQLITLPILLSDYYECSLTSILINMFVLPLASPLMVLGILGGFLGLFLLFPAKVLLFPCHLILLFYTRLCEINASFPFSTLIVGRPKNCQIYLYYAGILAIIIVIKHQKSENKTIFLAKRDKKGALIKGKIIARRVVYTLLIICLIGILFFRQNKATFTMLDVGQGDGIFLTDGAGYNIFVDGGSSSVKEVGEYRILPYLKYKGVRRIDDWLLSHTDSDHISGLLEILEAGYPVNRILLPSSADRQEENVKSLLDLAQKSGTEVLYLSAGDRILCDNLEVSCIFPEEKDSFEDINDGCMVLQVIYGEVNAVTLSSITSHSAQDIEGEDGNAFTILLTGDLGQASEEKLLNRGLPGRVDLLKVGHHGSKNSSSEEFLEKIQANYGFISVGEKNSYGHPAKESLDRLEKAGVEIHRTDEEGCLELFLSQ